MEDCKFTHTNEQITHIYRVVPHSVVYGTIKQLNDMAIHVFRQDPCIIRELFIDHLLTYFI